MNINYLTRWLDNWQIIYLYWFYAHWFPSPQELEQWPDVVTVILVTLQFEFDSMLFLDSLITMTPLPLLARHWGCEPLRPNLPIYHCLHSALRPTGFDSTIVRLKAIQSGKNFHLWSHVSVSILTKTNTWRTERAPYIGFVLSFVFDDHIISSNFDRISSNSHLWGDQATASCNLKRPLMPRATNDLAQPFQRDESTLAGRGSIGVNATA